jgi:drug/metabolite transporter (DMT)-like permease
MQNMAIGRQALGVVTLGILWSAQPAIVKYSAVSNTSPTAFLLSASACVAILLCTYNLVIRNCLRSIVEKWRFYQTSALLGFFLPLLTRLYISDSVPLHLLTVAVALTPVFVALIGGVCLGQTLSKITVLSLLLGLFGATLSIVPEISPNDISIQLKTLAVLLIPISYAINQIFVYRAYPEGQSPVQVAAGESAHTLLISSLFVAITALTSDSEVDDAFAVSSATLLWGVVTALEAVAFFWFSARANPLSVSVAIYAAIAFGIAWGWFVFGEEVTVTAMAGMGLIALSAAGIAYNCGVNSDPATTAGMV